MKEYFVNTDTLLLAPKSKLETKIYEAENIFTVNNNIMSTINESCMYFGSDYQGRYLGSKALLKMNYKLPIVVDEHREVIFFPSCSPRQDDCHWVSLNNIISYEKKEKKTLIKFKNNIQYELDMSYQSFESQIFRATMLLMLVKKRKSL